jgi:hypothetical protein
MPSSPSLGIRTLQAAVSPAVSIRACFDRLSKDVYSKEDSMPSGMAVLVLTLIPAVAYSQESTTRSQTANTIRLAADAPRPKARVADLAWLVGRWEGQGLGGTMDEVWSEPAGGAMVGYFRLVKDGKPVFYEIMTLLEVEDSVEMRLKHVNPDMTGWEEKNGYVTFRLVRQDATGAYFEGLTFRRVGADGIEGFIALRDKASGTVREEKLTYRRVQ